MRPAAQGFGESPWLLRRVPRPRAKLRLFCLPHAGGDSWIFHDWHLGLPETVELCPIRLPGRGSRMQEAPFETVAPLVAALADALRPALDLPYAIFGHSMGALIGFELAREIRRTAALAPAMLCVASHRAPHLPMVGPPASQLPPHLLLDDLHRRYGAGYELAENEELLDLMLPVLRADLSLCETYAYVEDAPLDSPIAAYGGVADAGVSAESLDAWELQTSQAFLRHALPGGHFFPVRSKAALLEILADDLAWAMS